MRGLLGACLAGLGALLLLLAVPVALVTPLLPIGLPLAAAGAVLVARNSRSGRAWMLAQLDRRPGLKRRIPDRALRAVFGKG